MIQIAPSLLAANLLRIGDEVRNCEAAGADVLHVDVMDGHFVPPITFGPAFVQQLRSITTLPMDVHLMVSNPDHQVEQFAEAGADWISVSCRGCAQSSSHVAAHQTPWMQSWNCAQPCNAT